MFTARFLQTTNRTLPHQSRLFARRAAQRCTQVVPAQPPSDMTADMVALERAIALAVVDEAAPTCIQPSTDDLIVAAAEPASEVPDAATESVRAPMADVMFVAATAAKSDTADAHESTSSVPMTKGKKRGKKREKSVSVAPRRKRGISEEERR